MATDMPTLTRDGVNEFIRANGHTFAIFADERPVREDAVVFEPQDSRWAVYSTSERGSIKQATHRTFDSESDALAYFVERITKRARFLRMIAEDDH